MKKTSKKTKVTKSVKRSRKPKQEAAPAATGFGSADLLGNREQSGV